MWLRREPFQPEKRACKNSEVGPCWIAGPLWPAWPEWNEGKWEWWGMRSERQTEPVPIDSYSSGDYLNVGMLWSPCHPLNTGYQPLSPAQSRAQKTTAKDRWGPWGQFEMYIGSWMQSQQLFIQRTGVSTWRLRGMAQESSGHGWCMAWKQSETRSSSCSPKPVTTAGLLWETQNPSLAGLCLGYKDSACFGCYCRTTK